MIVWTITDVVFELVFAVILVRWLVEILFEEIRPLARKIKKFIGKEGEAEK